MSILIFTLSLLCFSLCMSACFVLHRNGEYYKLQRSNKNCVLWTIMPRRKQRPVEEESTEEAGMPNGDSERRNLYELLGVERTASQEEIKKAYYKRALQLHPDKNPGDQDAKEKFQTLQNVIGILGDTKKRAIYDQTGSIDDAELSTETVHNLYQFFRATYAKVTEKDIEEFAAKYRGSEEEQQDLKKLYAKCNGDMNKVFDRLMCSIPNKDSHRFMDVLDAAISAGELKDYKVYRKWAKNVSKQERPRNPLAPPKKTKAAADSQLVTIISDRARQRMDSLTSSLLSKYGSNKKMQNTFAEPSEEEFQAARQRLNKKRKEK